jgi:hypothetical protein
MANRSIVPVFLMVLVLVAALNGCAGAASTLPDPAITDRETAPRPAETAGASIQPTPQIESTLVPDIPELRSSQTLPAGLERVLPTEGNPVVGEVPANTLDEIFADLAGRLGADLASIQVVRTEAVVWNDGSLGCPKPGEFYIQMLIDGYWVVLQVDGTDYDYRVSDKGYFTLCEYPSLGPPETSPLADN